MMTPEEEKRIASWGAGLTHQVKITVLESDDVRTSEMEAFCRRLLHLVPGLSIEKDSAGADSLPAIRIGRNLLYHAVPLGRELEPFLEAMDFMLGPSPKVHPSLKPFAREAMLPAFIKIFVTPECPFCPAAVRELLPICAGLPPVQVSVIDGGRFHELAKAYGIKAVPTVILDDAHRWTGTIKADELLEVLIDRDPSGLSPRAFERMLKEGDAGRLVEMIQEKGTLFPGFLELLFHASWPVRMGAMVVMEALSATHPDVARQAVVSLEARFDKVDDPVKGDLLYVLGELRDTGLIPWLGHILSGPYAGEVKEAAKEAIEKIENP